MAFAFNGPAWVEIFGAFAIGDITYPAEWLDPARWDGEALATEMSRLGIVEIAETDPPADANVTGSTIVDVGGVPTRQWTSIAVSLVDLKADLKRQADLVRDAHINGGCDTPHGRVDTDRESRLNISGSVQLANELGDAFTTPWRRADNTYVTLNKAAMKAVGIAAGVHVATCYGACFAIKDAIDAATTRAAARAIDREAGYPA